MTDSEPAPHRLVDTLQDAQRLVLVIGRQMVTLGRRVTELETAISKHRRYLEGERCTTCTTDNHQLWKLVDEGNNK